MLSLSLCRQFKSDALVSRHLSYRRRHRLHRDFPIILPRRPRRLPLDGIKYSRIDPRFRSERLFH